MRRFRFHLGTLVIVVLILGISFAALRESNETWNSGVFTLTLGVLLVSILLAVHRTESGRAFWIGFAQFGWIYLALSSVPSIESRLMTTKGLAYLDSKIPGRPLRLFTVRLTESVSGVLNDKVENFSFTRDGIELATPSLNGVRFWDVATGRLISGWGGTTENFVKIGHSLIALLAGWLGGLLSRRLWRASRPPEPETVVLS